MKLIFAKDANNEVTVQLQRGTVIEEFTYIEMVRQLLLENNIEVDYTNLETEEQTKLQGMLDKIKEVFKEGKMEDKA